MHVYGSKRSVAAGAFLAALWSGQAAAEDGGRDCSAVYDAARDEEQAGHLRAAAEFFRNCALDSCDSPVQRSCEAKLMRLELDAPSVVPLANDGSGEPLVDAQVTMDGVLLTSRLDGRAFPVDPGLHEFVFSAGGTSFGSTRLVIAQGQRNRQLWMVLPAAREPLPQAAELVQPEAAAVVQELPAPLEPAVMAAPAAATAAGGAHRSGVSLTPYVLGGTALLGAGAYALLSTWARDDNAQLGRCSPNCSRDSVSHTRSLYIAADISLGVGVAAALGSIAAFVLSGPSSKDEPARRYALSVQPERSGALATFRGTL
jgi:hypothetical protein